MFETSALQQAPCYSKPTVGLSFLKKEGSVETDISPRGLFGSWNFFFQSHHMTFYTEMEFELLLRKFNLNSYSE